MRPIHQLALVGAGVALISGCVQLKDLFGQPKGPDSQDCIVVRSVPAPMFHVGVTSPASAGATVSLEPWVVLQAPATKIDEILPGTFHAQVDAARREIVVSGQVRRYEPNLEAHCAFPALYMMPKAATLSVPVVLTATGTYTVRIASESFTSERPPAQPNPSLPAQEYPAAEATGSLVTN